MKKHYISLFAFLLLSVMDCYADYSSGFYVQGNADKFYPVVFNDDPSDKGTADASSFVTGQNGAFTVFSKSVGTAQGVSVTVLSVISGKVNASGVSGLQWSAYLVAKGSDPNGSLEPVGSTRIFRDDYATSPAQGTFALNLPATQSMPTGVTALLSSASH